MDLTRELRNVVGSGKVHFGVRQAARAGEEGTAKLLIVAKNCPQRESFGKFKRTYQFDGTNADLGSACGKPFTISVLTVIEPGESAIMDLL